MLRLHLIRHGETGWNREKRVQGQRESELNQTGREQAGALQQTVQELALSAIYVSSAVRTRQTAEILTEGIALPQVYRDDLREISLGAWETRLWSEVEEEFPEQTNNFHHQPERFFFDGAESFADLQQRGVQAIESIVQQEVEGNVLVVSHGALLKTILLHYAGIDLAHLWAGPALYNCAHSVLAASSGSDLQVESIAGVAATKIQWPTTT